MLTETAASRAKRLHRDRWCNYLATCTEMCSLRETEPGSLWWRMSSEKGNIIRILERVLASNSGPSTPTELEVETRKGFPGTPSSGSLHKIKSPGNRICRQFCTAT